MRSFVDAQRILGDIAECDAPFGERTTYGVGGRAALLVTPSTVDDLHKVAAVVQANRWACVVIGRGSNTLVADAGFDGVVVSLDKWDDISITGNDVRAGAGALLPVVARATVAAGLSGFEWAVGVPGTIGGGVRMNAGGHGNDMVNSLVGVRVFDVLSGEDTWMPAASLGLRFRGSSLPDHHIVIEAALRLFAGDVEKSRSELREVVRWRRAHQPGGQNAGSVFVNPVPGVLSAGQVIDEVGLRGVRLGSAEVSPKHANFIQADPGGSADDVFALMAHVRDRVLIERGIALRSENRLLGFSTVAWASEGR